MPNYCVCYLTVRGEDKRLEKFFEKNSQKPEGALYTKEKPQPLWFGASVPLKKDEWGRSVWGCKWEPDIEPEYVQRNTEEIIYTFYTAWSPPSLWLEEVVSMYPDLCFELVYEEIGNELYGVMKGEEGVLEDTELTGHEYLEQYNEVYREEKEGIQQQDPKELLEELLEAENPLNIITYYQNECAIVERLNQNDLPMVINFEWHDKALKILNNRLKGGILCPTQNQ